MSCEQIDEVVQGADLSVKTELYDQEGNLIDASLLDKLIVKVYHASGTEVAKFSMNTSVGFGDIDMTNAASGEIGFKLLSTHTLNSPIGKVYYEVHGQYNEGSVSDDGVLDIIKTEVYLCNIVKSQTTGITLP